MSTVTEQDDRRSRRRVALLWLGSLMAVAALAVAGVYALDRDGSTSNPLVDGGGSGTALVLEEPPVDVDLPAEGGPSTTATPYPTRQVFTTTHEGGSVFASTPRASGGPALGAPRTHGVNLVLTSTLSMPLRPGKERTLYVKVRNPNTFPVDVFRIDVRVDDSPAPGCRSASPSAWSSPW